MAAAAARRSVSCLIRKARLPVTSKLAGSATGNAGLDRRLWGRRPHKHAQRLQEAGVLHRCRRDYMMAGLALPELLEDLAGQGISTVLGRGRGRKRRGAFLTDGLVDRIALFQGPGMIGVGGIPSPIDANSDPARGSTSCGRRVSGTTAIFEWARGSDVHRHCHRRRHGRQGFAPGRRCAAAHRNHLQLRDDCYRCVDFLRRRVPDGRERFPEAGSNAAMVRGRGVGGGAAADDRPPIGLPERASTWNAR